MRRHSACIAFGLAVAAFALVFVAGCGEDEDPAATYFDKPLTFIVHAGAGGNLDLKVRMVAKYLEPIIKQTIVVENEAGAGGVTAATNYLQQKPNTRRVLVMGDQMFSIAPRTTTVKYKFEDFAPVIGLDVVKAGLFVNPKTIKNLDDYIALGKGKGIVMADNGRATGSFIAQAVVNRMLDLQYDSVTYKSAAESLTNVYAGHCDAAWAAMHLGNQYQEEGILLPLLTFAPEDYVYANGTKVPSARSLGIDMEHQNFLFFALRGGTDAKVVDKLSKAIAEVYANKNFQDEAAKMSVTIHPLDPKKTKEHVDNAVKAMDAFYTLIK